MAQKLKNMKLTSVDLVKAGANQKADICLYKSADHEDPAQEAPESPTEHEKNIFKRFIGWLHDTLTDFDYEPDGTIEKADETEEEPEANPTDLYKSAIIESLQSIVADETLSADEKNGMIEKSLGQYHEAMMELAKAKPALEAEGEEEIPEIDEEDEEDEEDEDFVPTEKSAPDFEDIEEV